MALTKEQIAQRIAQELKDGYYVNLGIGIPTLVANYIPNGIDVVLQSENGNESAETDSPKFSLFFFHFGCLLLPNLKKNVFPFSYLFFQYAQPIMPKIIGNVFKIMSFKIARRKSGVRMASVCWVEITTVSMRTT